MPAENNKPDIQTIEQRLDAVPTFNSLCFELFRQWTAKVKNEMANWEPDINHEQEIVWEVRKAYITAIQESYKDADHQDLMDMKEYYIVASGITGFVQGTLGSVWSLRYLPKNESYRQMLWMKSITQYFFTFEEAAQEVNRLFTTYVQTGFLINQDENELTEDDISFYKVMADLQFEKNRQEMVTFLHSNMMDYGLKFMTNTKEIDPPNVLDIFGASNVAFLLTGKWLQATLEGPRGELPDAF